MANFFPGAQEITADKIRDAIIKKSGPGNSVTIKRVSWFPLRDAVTGMAMLSGCPENERASVIASMKRLSFDIAQPCPLETNLLIFGLFEEEEEIRVYCMGPSKPTQIDEKPHLVLARYRLSKSSSIYSMDELTPNAFVDEMSDDFVQLREGMNSAEKERASVLQYGDEMADNPPGSTPYTLKEFLDDLREGVHLEDETEDEDEDEETDATASAPKSPVPTFPGTIQGTATAPPPPPPVQPSTISAASPPPPATVSGQNTPAPVSTP